jgi:CubicO group peptidase (beta-lactamase class C family)
VESLDAKVTTLLQAIDRVAGETGFSGVVRVDRDDSIEFAKAYGLAHRGFAIRNELDTRFGLASGSTGLTAMTVVSLIEDGALDGSTTARSILGRDLPLIDDAVTVEQLLAHRSGIGDYIDEDVPIDATDFVLAVPVHELASTEDYLKVLDGRPTKFQPGERFSYCNSGYVVLALIAERVAASPFDELVAERVCRPAGADDTAFLRSDEPAGRTALHYLTGDGVRTNALHLPVRGSGDGGAYSTATDIHAIWSAFLAGRVVSPEWVARMTSVVSEVRPGSLAYGLGFWLRPSAGVVFLEGYDAGVSFRSAHRLDGRLTYTVLANWTEGAWPLARLLDDWISRS